MSSQGKTLKASYQGKLCNGTAMSKVLDAATKEVTGRI
jgi:hypothetical protein